MEFKFYITPVLNRQPDGTPIYADEIDITRYVSSSAASIKREIDAGINDIGLYGFGRVRLSLINFDGLFNNPFPFADGRSIFTEQGRDLAKVRMAAIDGGNEFDVFNGLVSDLDADQTLIDHTVSLTVLGLDSILKKVAVTGGVILTGATISSTIKRLLDRPAIKSVLNVDFNNITVGNDTEIDNNEVFFGLDTKEALDLLLLASASVLVVDADGNVIVQGRGANDNTPHAFYGAFDPQERGNIISITNVSNGIARAFNRIVIDKQVIDSQKHIIRYGLRKKELGDVKEFITNVERRQRVGIALISAFAEPKMEMRLTIPFDRDRDIKMLDGVTVDNPLYAPPAPGQEPTYYEASAYDSGNYHQARNSLLVKPDVLFKVIGIEHRLKDNLTILRLRQE